LAPVNGYPHLSNYSMMTKAVCRYPNDSKDIQTI
jgi:hypothetical protein